MVVVEAVVSAQKSRRALAYGGRAGVDCDRTPVVTPIWVGVVSERPMNDSSSTPKMLSQLMALGPAVSVRVLRDIRRVWYPNHDCNLRAITDLLLRLSKPEPPDENQPKIKITSCA